ncbi:MAG: hypothetical protein IKW08_00830 [Roseburia sp.]|nr:hypothetical protein [Roseburia sp.]
MSEVSYAIQNLNSTINQFESNVDVHVNNIRQSSINVEDATKEIYNQISKFREDMEHGEQSQLAHENIIRIDQIIKEQFSSYETIRRTVMGVVRDFDINLVRNSTIQELSEELWMTSSRYWLAYALIGITAWVNNYPDVAKNALAECGRKDAIKATLFFCLLNLRFDRTDVAKCWFYEYLKTLDPTMLQQESAVMLHAFLDGIFGKDRELEQSVVDVIDQWISIINDDVVICEQLITNYETYLKNINPGKTFDYASILKYCTNSAELSKSYLEVSKYDIVLALLKELDVDAVEQNDNNYKERVDAVLINLISNYDEEERELRNEQEYFNLIVKNEGVVEKAEAQYQAEMELQNEHFNIGKQMISWAIYDETANSRVRKFAFQNTKEWFKSALDKFAIQMERAFPIEYFLAIDTWSGVSNGTDQAELTENMRNYYQTNKFQNMFVNTLNIAAAIVIVASLALAFVTPYSLVATVAAGIFLGYRCFKAIKEYPKRVEAAINALQQTLAEISEFRQYFEDNSKKKDEILSATEFI